MAVTQPVITGTPQAFAYTTTGNTATYTGGGTANATSYDVLYVNSDNTVATPSGFSLVTSRVVNQGSYIFIAPSPVTSATFNLGGAINAPISVLWIRITNSDGVDAGATATAGADATFLSNTPAVTSGALAAATNMATAFAALHGFASTPTSGGWSTGYTEQLTGTTTTGSTGVYGSVGIKVPAGTAAESPTYAWTNASSERYILFAAFLGHDAGSSGVTPAGIAATVSLGTPTVALGLTAAPAGIAVTVARGTPSVALNLTAAPAGIAVTTALGSPNVTSTPAPNGIAVFTALGSPTVALNLTAAPAGIAVTTALGAPSIVQSAGPSGIALAVGLGNPTVSATVLTAGAPGSWWGLLTTDKLNLQYLREDSGTPVACPNDGEPLQLNPRTRAWQCPYDGYVHGGF